MPKKGKRQNNTTLSDIIEMVIRKNGGTAPLSVIYKEVRALKPNVSEATIRAIIRDACVGTLRKSTDIPRFIRVNKGVYAVCDNFRKAILF
jgi:hypothetical protein